MKKHTTLIPFTLIVLCITNLSFTQLAKENDALVFSSPTVKFNDIVIQQYNGLPKFGTLNTYIDSNQSYQLNKEVSLGYYNYFKMITFKYLADFYKDMDMERITKTPSPTNKNIAQENSYTAQTYLRNFSATICLEENCKNAFGGNNEFEQLRNYKNFIKENYTDLRNWSNTFFTNDNQTAYHVSQVYLQSYDFDKNGYWVYLNLSIAHGSRAHKKPFVFEPKADYEHTLLSNVSKNYRQKHIDFFIHIKPELAEKFQLNNIRHLYLVKKIKLTNKGIKKGRNHTLQLSYNHENPNIEIYQDKALTKKIGTLSLNNLVIKKQ